MPQNNPGWWVYNPFLQCKHSISSTL